jgi:hypothetical protein
MSWAAFSARVRVLQRGFMGEPKEVRPGREEFHENPSTCICERTGGKTVTKSKSGDEQGVNYGAQEIEVVSEPEVPSLTDEEAGESEVEEDAPGEKEDDDALVRAEDPELEQVLSD